MSQELELFLLGIGWVLVLLAGIGGFAMGMTFILNLYQHRPFVQRILRHL